MEKQSLICLENWNSVQSLAIEAPPIQGMEIPKKLITHAVGMRNDWMPAIGSVFENESFSALSMKRGIAKNCTFYNCDFSRVAGTASLWSGSRFINCDLSETNFDYADFSESAFLYDKSPIKSEKFKGAGLSGASFSGATFARSTLKNVYIRGTALTRINFTNAEITNCHIQSCTLEGADFTNAKINQMEFSRLNLEYCDFTNVTFTDVSIGIMQFPYIFGITEKSIRKGRLKIQTDNTEAHKDGVLSWEELLQLIPELISYFLNNQNFFPVCNLYLASNRTQEFTAYLNAGIRQHIVNKDFRGLKFLCKLAKVSELFNKNELEGLYELISNSLLESKRDVNTLHSYHMHEGEIRGYLVPHKPQGTIRLSMTIKKHSTNKLLNSFVDCVHLIQMACLSLNIETKWNHLSASKNSPIRITVNIIVINNNSEKVKKEKKHNLIQLLNIIFMGAGVAISAVGSAALWYKNLELETQGLIQDAQTITYNNFNISSFYIADGSSILISNSDKKEGVKNKLPLIDI